MAIEHERDAKMTRTEDRPVAAGRMSCSTAVTFGIFLSTLGASVLAAQVNPLTGGLAAGSLLVYVLLYTPLKPVTTLNTLIGAVSGAIPPMIGWAATRNDVALGAWVLFAIMFFWQLPHFLAIAWMYRTDYARAGYKMMPVLDPDGASTSRQAVLQTMALLAASLMPGWIGMAGPVYYVTAALLGVGFLAFALAFAASRTSTRARRLFLASIAYLPLLLAVLALTKV
jgi:protoheme IX farnesyltransferase